VRIRGPYDDLPPDDDDHQGGGDGSHGGDGPAPGVRHGADGSVYFLVSTGVIVGKFVVAALLVLIALTAGRGFSLWLGLVASGLVAGYGLRDALGRERLRATPDGVRVGTGFGRHRELAWSQLERVRVDQRLRLGLRTDMLELDAAEELFLFSRYDLGAEPRDALAALRALHPGI
jgi:Bacterial PH domain